MVYRDYIHVDDVAQVINLIIEKGNPNEIYNVGNGQEIYLKDALQYAVKASDSKSNLNTVPPAEFHKIVQTKNMVLDNTKIENLGYLPKYNIYQIIDTLVK
jgi:nucleoside-diphosphate-sugar epimerase